MMGCPKKTVVQRRTSVKKKRSSQSLKQNGPERLTGNESNSRKVSRGISPGMQDQFSKLSAQDIHFNFDKYDIRPEDKRF